jgi:hypothetical protein
MAVSNETKNSYLYLKEQRTHSFISSKNDLDFKKIPINITSIDDFLKNKTMKINFILMDAEGSEPFILEGMTETLKKNPTLEIITEYNPYALESAGSTGNIFLNTISKMGFQTYLVAKNGNLENISNERILETKYPHVLTLYLKIQD